MNQDTPDADRLIEAWTVGDATIDDADQIVEVDDETIQARFLTEDGPVIFTYQLQSGYRPRGDEHDCLDEFNPLETQ